MALYGGGTSTTLSVWTSWIKAYTYSRDDVQYGFFFFFALFLISLMRSSELSVQRWTVWAVSVLGQIIDY